MYLIPKLMMKFDQNLIEDNFGTYNKFLSSKLYVSIEHC